MHIMRAPKMHMHMQSMHMGHAMYMYMYMLSMYLLVLHCSGALATTCSCYNCPGGCYNVRTK